LRRVRLKPLDGLCIDSRTAVQFRAIRSIPTMRNFQSGQFHAMAIALAVAGMVLGINGSQP
jgi:hypothetical protein